jgi:hypothetical protein
MAHLRDKIAIKSLSRFYYSIHSREESRNERIQYRPRCRGKTVPAARQRDLGEIC